MLSSSYHFTLYSCRRNLSNLKQKQATLCNLNTTHRMKLWCSYQDNNDLILNPWSNLRRAAGTVDAYVILDWEAGVARLGSNRTKLVPELALPQLVGTLTAFIIQYNQAAELLEKFVPLCESLLDGIPSKKKESEEKVNSSS